MKRALHVMVGLVLCSGCPGELVDPDRFLVPTCEIGIEVEKDLFEPTCGVANCHVSGTNAAGSLDLVSPGVASRLLGVAGTGCAGRPLIDPDDPESSALLDRIGLTPECGARMPLTGPALSPEQIACVRAYVFETVAGPAALRADSW